MSDIGEFIFAFYLSFYFYDVPNKHVSINYTSKDAKDHHQRAKFPERKRVVVGAQKNTIKCVD